MPKYEGKLNFSFLSAPEVGGKQCTHIKVRRRKNNGQLRFLPPPQVEYASCLDQKSKFHFYGSRLDQKREEERRQKSVLTMQWPVKRLEQLGTLPQCRTLMVQMV